MLAPEWKRPEPELKFTREQRKRNLCARKNPLRVMPRDKRRSVHAVAGTNRSVLRVHPEAIEIGVSTGEGVAKYLGFFGVLVLAVSLLVIRTAFLVSSDMLVALFAGLFGVLFFLLSLVMIRRGFFSPSDHPVLFNRKTREVHVIPIKTLNFLKFWEKGEPGELRSYRWDHVTARTYRRLDVPGGTVARTETVLQMLCTTPESPNAVDLMVSLGFTGTWRDNTQVELWEHIRRYMEEGGPPLQPGDTLRKVNHDKLPEFPPDIVDAAGGPALSEAELAKWTQPQS